MASAAERWIEDQERLAKPAKVYWCDGSDGEAWRLLEIGMNEERLNGPVFQPLNHESGRRPTSTVPPRPTSRASSTSPTSAIPPRRPGPNNNWMAPVKAREA